MEDSDLGVFLGLEFDGTPGLMEEFPLLIGVSNRQRRFVIHERGQIVAHAAWRPLELHAETDRPWSKLETGS